MLPHLRGVTGDRAIGRVVQSQSAISESSEHLGSVIVHGDTTIEQAASRVDNVVDTTGAGDAFAAGLIAALVGGKDLKSACLAGNLAGARIVQRLGAITAWLETESP